MIKKSTQPGASIIKSAISNKLNTTNKKAKK